MELSEFRALVEACRKNDNHIIKYTGSAFFIFQFHMIGHLDDVFRFRCEDITRNNEFPFALKSKMRWSKNVLEERDAPDQIILGAMDPSFCPLLGIAMHIELPNRLGVIGINTEDPTLFKIKKERISGLFRELSKDPSFPHITDGKIGTHSIRKLPATYARRNGCSRDDVDARGRWKTHRRMVDTYIDNCIPYPDAKVASILCIGGAVKYMVRTISNITSDFILTNICPHIQNIFPREVSLVLGTALLWAFYDDTFSNIFPQDIVQSIKIQVGQLGGDLPQSQNPVKKIPILVNGDGGVLVITPFCNDEEEDMGENGASSVLQSQQQIQLSSLFQQMNQLKQQHLSLENEIKVLKVSVLDQMGKLHRAVTRIANSPIMFSRVRNTEGGQEGLNELGQQVDSRATLCLSPRSLYTLWLEFEQGVGGRKPAKLFTPTERGRCKHKYCFRKPFWELVVQMIQSGYTSYTAIDKIYDAYGQFGSVSKMLREIKSDRGARMHLGF